MRLAHPNWEVQDMQLRSAADVCLLAAPDARVYEQHFLFKECGLLVGGPGAMWVDQSTLAEARIVAMSPGGKVLALRTIHRQPRLYLVNWPPVGGAGVGGEPGLIWPRGSVSYPALVFSGERNYLEPNTGLEQPALIEGVLQFAPIFNEALSPIAIRWLESRGFSRNAADVLGKVGTAFTVGVVVSPWTAHLLPGAMLIHFTSLVLPFGEAGAWPSDKLMMEWAKKKLISLSPKPVSDALPIALAMWRSLGDGPTESDKARRRRPGP
jgi:hypothetical protein